MLIYDRRRCRPLPGVELRRRLTLMQRAKLAWYETMGWRLLFVRGEPASAFLAHEEKGLARIVRDGRVLSVRSLALRPEDRDARMPLAEGSAGAA
ncbi:MAG TPA: hypothetical protein VIG88_06965 [Lysobacter sp.]